MRYLLLLVTSIGSIGCACKHKHAILSERGAKKAVVTMVNAIDTKDWKLARSQFADEVFVDYSSMTGQPGAIAKAKDLVGGWEKLLAKAETHHMLTNFEMSQSEDEVEVFSHVYASHTAKGVRYWDIYGRYQHKLRRTSKGWQITFMKLIVHGQKGNLQFLKQLK